MTASPHRAMTARLSAMMFLQYFVGGAVLPIISHYLKNFLGFGPAETGWIIAMPSLAAILAPFVVTAVADRVMSAERLLGLCHLLAGCVMIALSRQTGYWPVLALYFVYGSLFMPTFALSNAVAFHHLEDPKRDFGLVRMWGPISWVVMGWGFGYLWLRGGGSTPETSRLPDALLVSAVSSFALSVYCLTLPASKPHGDAPAPKQSLLAPLKTIGIFLRPNLLLLCLLTFGNAVVHQFYYYGMGPYLHQIGFPDKYIMPAMSMGQFGETFVLFSLGYCLARLGAKRAMFIGVMAQVTRCVVFAIGAKPLILAVIPLHGICYAFFFSVAYLYVDQHSTRQTRAGAQQMFNILIAGFGNFIGNIFAGYTAKFFVLPGTSVTEFRYFWLTSASLALVIAIVLGLMFRNADAAES
ncbi:MAG: nucleoside permease, partial [bacterium]|nr:nucleoside permease [bacterium]